MGTSLKGPAVVVPCGSRGIGLAVLSAAAREGANAVIPAKTDKSHAGLPGIVHTAVAGIEAAAGSAVAVVGDVRSGADAECPIATAVDRFGGVDNAGTNGLGGTEKVPPKRFGLMQSTNTRGAFPLTRARLPHLRRSCHAHVLTPSPQLNLAPRWFRAHPVCLMTKCAMTAHSWLGRRVRRSRQRRELPVAADHDRDRASRISPGSTAAETIRNRMCS